MTTTTDRNQAQELPTLNELFDGNNSYLTPEEVEGFDQILWEINQEIEALAGDE